MNREQAEYLMCNLGLLYFPNMPPISKEACQKHCEAFTLITGRKATPKEVKTSWPGGTMYVPDCE